MKRLLRISLNVLFTSALPIVSWILLGIIVRPEIADVFSLTYPMQFLFVVLMTIFAIGANITAKLKHDKNVVMTNLVVGSIVFGIFTAVICANIDAYLEQMNVTPEVYRDFAIYAFIRIAEGNIIMMISQKLYYKNEIKKTNTINLVYGACDFILITVLNSITDHTAAIIITLCADSAITAIFFFRNYDKWKFSLRLFDNIKNASFEILDSLGMFLAYGLGYANSFSYGKEFLNAINFETLITDAQWDMLNESVGTAARVDIAERKFNYRKMRRQALAMSAIMLGTSAILGLVLYWYYKPDLLILLILFGSQVIDMFFDPINHIRWSYLQIRDNKLRHNAVFVATRLVRIVCSFIPTGFCVYIGELSSTAIKYIYSRYQCRNFREFKITKTSSPS